MVKRTTGKKHSREELGVFLYREKIEVFFIGWFHKRRNYVLLAFSHPGESAWITWGPGGRLLGVKHPSKNTYLIPVKLPGKTLQVNFFYHKMQTMINLLVGVENCYLNRTVFVPFPQNSIKTISFTEIFPECFCHQTP